MNFQHVVVSDWEWLLPEQIISSLAIEEQLAPLYQRLNLSSGRLEMLTGVSERRIWPAGTFPGELAAQTARPLLLRHPELFKKLDLVINASVCRDQLEPATAARVHARLELPSTCAFFDLSNACLGVIQSMELAAQLIEKGSMRSIMIVAAENSGPLLSNTLKALSEDSMNKKLMRPLIANLTIGSGAVAVLMCHDSVMPAKIKLKHSVTRTRSQAFHLCRGGGDNHNLEMFTDSEQLLHEGIALARETWQAGDMAGKIKAYLTHQVGSAHTQLLHQALEMGELPSFNTYPYLGNTGPVALPITLMHALEQHQLPLEKGDRLALLGIGSGLSSTMLEMEI